MSHQTISYTELPYEITTDAVYHSSFRPAASARLTNQLSGPVATAVRHALSVNASRQVWAIVIENDGQPMYVVQNMKYTLTPDNHRRVLRVRLPDPYLAPST
jgi:hypothetical protein